MRGLNRVVFRLRDVRRQRSGRTDRAGRASGLHRRWQQQLFRDRRNAFADAVAGRLRHAQPDAASASPAYRRPAFQRVAPPAVHSP